MTTERPSRPSGPFPAAVTVDLVILTVREGALHVLLIERGNEPFRGSPALPGGYVRPWEGLDETALRELREETGLDGRRLHLEQLRSYGAPDRDPRGRTVTVAYLALGPDLPVPVAGTDAHAARWVPVARALGEGFGLAFDHAAILADGVERARSQLEYTTAATAFCTEPFTMSELRGVYEVVWGISLDPSNFRRKVTRTAGFVVPTGERRAMESGRPAALYRRGPARDLYPPLLRSSEMTASG
ncbi:NUDIX domain-containing protein [Streptomonospora nanhaiensis]|uniref:8-oxo-dGTP diphosphatase n=1 Tax=Streptomonospora nanhaiensis TaxID=1323731 RepID=A0A853BKK8_9ACTN|nr:NUDIX domain-containing protein [Streptomonospora nanhaiensis]NYI95244.1 8-oxo-dGTP diphosphatase [Streptomonospora nanhaiensis]